MNMRDYSTLHLDTNPSKGTACSKTGHGCKVHLHPCPVLLQAVPLLGFVSKCNVG
jgi:hypothetical protein